MSHIDNSNNGGKAQVADGSTLAPGLRMLPSDARADVYRLYDVLRTLDDLVDEERPHAARRVEAVERWACNEPADTYETRVLSELSQRHSLPAGAFLEFCAGMRHDISRAVICDEEELELYCQRAGGSVGIMLTHILGSAGAECETRMATLGRAVQRTNILRDIDEDATHGRVYVARSTIERFGAPLPGGRAELLRDQIARADELYEQAAGATSLLASGQPGMTVCAALYREILRQIERDGYGRTPGRAVVPAWRQSLLIAEYCVKPRRNSTSHAAVRA
ncbi:MAG TPA: squalene/phytoene synthase family protein [Solirubrobacteraceae bacterium]|nr:squalene/phytoene synthase family protein [Solirubrobacteraceae bacterium]